MLLVGEGVSVSPQFLYRAGTRLAGTGAPVSERRWRRDAKFPSKWWWKNKISNKMLASKELAAAWARRADQRDTKRLRQRNSEHACGEVFTNTMSAMEGGWAHKLDQQSKTFFPHLLGEG